MPPLDVRAALWRGVVPSLTAEAAAEVLACLYLEYEVAEIRLKAAAIDAYRRSIVEPNVGLLNDQSAK